MSHAPSSGSATKSGNISLFDVSARRVLSLVYPGEFDAMEHTEDRDDINAFLIEKHGSVFSWSHVWWDAIHNNLSGAIKPLSQLGSENTVEFFDHSIRARNTLTSPKYGNELIFSETRKTNRWIRHAISEGHLDMIDELVRHQMHQFRQTPLARSFLLAFACALGTFETIKHVVESVLSAIGRPFVTSEDLEKEHQRSYESNWKWFINSDHDHAHDEDSSDEDEEEAEDVADDEDRGNDYLEAGSLESMLMADYGPPSHYNELANDEADKWSCPQPDEIVYALRAMFTVRGGIESLPVIDYVMNACETEVCDDSFDYLLVAASWAFEYEVVHELVRRAPPHLEINIHQLIPPNRNSCTAIPFDALTSLQIIPFGEEQRAVAERGLARIVEHHPREQVLEAIEGMLCSIEGRVSQFSDDGDDGGYRTLITELLNNLLRHLQSHTGRDYARVQHHE